MYKFVCDVPELGLSQEILWKYSSKLFRTHIQIIELLEVIVVIIAVLFADYIPSLLVKTEYQCIKILILPGLLLLRA